MKSWPYPSHIERPDLPLPIDPSFSCDSSPNQYNPSALLAELIERHTLRILGVPELDLGEKIAKSHQFCEKIFCISAFVTLYYLLRFLRAQKGRLFLSHLIMNSELRTIEG